MISPEKRKPNQDQLAWEGVVWRRKGKRGWDDVRTPEFAVREKCVTGDHQAKG